MVGPRSVAVALAAAVLLAACSNTSDSGPDQTTGTTTTTEPTPPVSDGQLTIGVMLPLDATLLRDPIDTGTTLAKDRVNSNGGLFGQPVILVPADEGDTAATGAAAVQQLLDANVDAIIGPASSTIAASTLTSIVSKGVVACSPTASALSLDQFPDHGLFFRTVPSDTMQAKAIAQTAEETGRPSVVVAYVDDGFGRPLYRAVADALAEEPIELVAAVPFASGEADQAGAGLADSVQKVIAADARVLILLAGSNDGTQFLDGLSDASGSNLSRIIVNDALRSAESVQRIAALRPAIRQMIRGVAPQADSGDPTRPFDPAGPFATQAFDCVTLIALAAGIAGSDRGADIARVLPSVSTGGQPCDEFAECFRLAQEETQINYNGPSGLTDIGPAGDPIRARFDQFSFDVEGNDTLSSEAIDVST